MKIGDLVIHINDPEVYGFVVAVVDNKWIGARCAVVWLRTSFDKKWYAFGELVVLNENR